MIVFQLMNFAICPIVFSPTGIARAQSLSIRLSLIVEYFYYHAQRSRLFSSPKTVFSSPAVEPFCNSYVIFEFSP